MTREQWLERFIGAYAAFAGCDIESAEAVAKEFDGHEIDTSEECPVESAKASWEDQEDPAEPAKASWE